MKEYLAEKLGVNREVLALSAARFVDAFSNSILIIILPLFVAELPSRWLNLPEETLVGILIATFGLIASASQPPFGVLSDRVGKRKIFIIIGLGMMGVATFVFAEAEQFIHLILIRAIQAVGFALTIPATLSLMAEYTQIQTRGGAMGIYTTMRMVGFAIGPLAGGFIQVHYGFRTAFYMVGAISLLSVVIVALLVQESQTTETIHENDDDNSLSFREALTGEFIILGIATVVTAAAISMMVALENEFNARLSQTAIGFGLAFSALTFSRVFLQIPLGRLTDFIGRKRVIIVGLLVLAPTTLLQGFVETTGQLVVVRLAQGVGMAGISAPVFALAADKSKGGRSGTQMSIVTTSFGLGIAVGPVIAGTMAGFISFQSPFIFTGALCLLAAVLVWRFVVETVRR